MKIDNYTLGEATKGQTQLNAMLSRPLDRQHSDGDAADLLDSLRNGVALERARWVMNGSYGFEYCARLIVRYRDILSEPKHFQQPRLRALAISAHMTACLADYPALNAYKIRQTFKQLSADEQAAYNEALTDALIESMEDE